MYAIEKRVPLSEKNPAIKASSYPFSDMEIGDSFLIAESETTASRIEAVRSYAIRVAKSHGMRVATRKVAGGVRIWRTA